MAEQGEPPAGLESENPSCDSGATPTKQALRIQAAAVAAQHAALTEMELRLEQRSHALEQQENQLGTHLEEQRRGLEVLRTETRHAQQSLRKDRATFEARVAQALERLASDRRELDKCRLEVRQERRRLMDLRRRMIRRWHQHWARERLALEHKEADLEKARQEAEKAARRLQQEKDAHTHAWQKANGNLALRRRNLEETQDALRAEQQQLSALARGMVEREAILEAAQRELTNEKQKWEAKRRQLLDEIQGLETRARHARAKLREDQGIRPQQVRPEPQRDSTSTPHGDGASCSRPANSHNQSSQEAANTALPLQPLTELEQLASELADQRLVLSEGCSRLTQLQIDWQEMQETLAADLETLAHRFDQRESVLVRREDEMARRDQAQCEQELEFDRAHEELLALKSCFASQKLSWEGEKVRHLTEAAEHARLHDDQLQAAQELRQRWEERRERQVMRLRSQLQACVELQMELSGLRKEFFDRRSVLDQERRQLAERTLALEQLRQEYIARAEDPAAAERRLNSLLHQWSEEAAAIEAALARERRAIEKQLSRMEERLAQLREYGVELAERDSVLAKRETSWEEGQATLLSEQKRLHQELAMVRSHRETYQWENQELREEVEKLARLLMDQPPSIPRPVSQAA
jgi:chromosome segregation ATPase